MLCLAAIWFLTRFSFRPLSHTHWCMFICCAGVVVKFMCMHTPIKATNFSPIYDEFNCIGSVFCFILKNKRSKMQFPLIANRICGWSSQKWMKTHFLNEHWPIQNRKRWYRAQEIWCIWTLLNWSSYFRNGGLLWTELIESYDSFLSEPTERQQLHRDSTQTMQLKQFNDKLQKTTH